MRCVACNCVLSDYEATRKGTITGEYLDLCDDCFKPIADEVAVIVRHDLDHSLDNTEGDMDVKGEPSAS